MNHRLLETLRAPLLLAAALLGLFLGWAVPGVQQTLGTAIWPLLGLLLFVSFLEINLGQWRRGLVDRRFLAAILVLNFLVLPPLVGGLLLLVDVDPALQLAVALVLLAPCTDWFLGFNLIGGGNPERAAVATPLLLATQVVLVPLWLLLLPVAVGPLPLPWTHLAAVFFGILVVPLMLALAGRRLASRRRHREQLDRATPVSALALLALVVFAICASEAQQLFSQPLTGLAGPALVYGLWFPAALLAARTVGRISGIAIPARRTLAYSASSRNSFLVLPFVLALSGDSGLAAAAVILQSIMELFWLILLTSVAARLPRYPSAAP